MEKKLLLKNILTELNQLPDSYLQHWYDLIHTFRKGLPTQKENPNTLKEEGFDWDALVEETMKNRQQSNDQIMTRMDSIL